MENMTFILKDTLISGDRKNLNHSGNLLKKKIEPLCP